MTVSSILRSPYLGASIFAVVIFGGAPWVAYGVGLFAAGGTPEPPRQIAPASEQLELWQKLGGTGEPSLDRLLPYTYLATVDNPGPDRPGLLATYTVSSGHLLEHRRFEGRQWWSLSTGSLTIWLSRNWSMEQILSKLIEMRNDRRASPDGTAR